jgi:anthranilate synthase component 2
VERGGLMHGKTSAIAHDGTGVFEGLPSPFTATRYHSLVVNDVPDTLRVNARTDDGLVMGLAHATLPIHGVQFHPESIATEHGHAMLANFLRIAGLPVRELA